MNDQCHSGRQEAFKTDFLSERMKNGGRWEVAFVQYQIDMPVSIGFTISHVPRIRKRKTTRADSDRKMVHSSWRWRPILLHYSTGGELRKNQPSVSRTWSPLLYLTLHNYGALKSVDTSLFLNNNWVFWGSKNAECPQRLTSFMHQSLHSALNL